MASAAISLWRHNPHAALFPADQQRVTSSTLKGRTGGPERTRQYCMDWKPRGLAPSTLPYLQHDEEADDLGLVVETSCQGGGPGERRKGKAREEV